MSYKCRHFAIHELVPPHIFEQYGGRAWEFLDDRILITIDQLRDEFGPMTVNNYKYGGERKWSGLRTPESPWYSTGSQHSFGRGVDIIFANYTAEEARKVILENPEKYPYIHGIELGVSWLHIDCRNYAGLKKFNK